MWTGTALAAADLLAIYAEAGLRFGIAAGGDAALSGAGNLAASGSGAAFGSATLSATGTLSAAGGIGAPEEPEEESVEEPIYAIATVPIAAFEEPTAPEAEDLLRLNTSAVIDFVYLLELRPFAPAGTSLPT